MNKRSIIALFVIYLFILVFFLVLQRANAHSGRTDSSGGHNCYVGACAGTYHYHNGGYNPPAPTYVFEPKFPISTNASWIFTANSNKTYDISMELDDSNPTQYSAVISKCKGCDPGPLTDFYTNKFIFEDISPGVWYVNVKKEILGTWSNVVWWTIEVPVWVKPIPSPSPIIIPNNVEPIKENISNQTLPSDFIGLVLILLIGGLILLVIGVKLILWIIRFLKSNPELFWIIILILIFLAGIL